MATFIQAILALTILCSAALGLLVYTCKRLTYLRSLLIIHLISIGSWAMAALLALQHGSWFAIGLGYASAAVLVTSKFYFIISFPGPKVTLRPWGLLPLLMTIPIVIFSFKKDIFVSGFSVINDSYLLIVDGTYAKVYLLSIFIIIIIPIIDLYKKMRSQDYPTHIAEQIKFLFLGLTFFFILGFVTNSVLPVIFNIYYFNGIGPSLALILAGFILYIITRYHFLNLSLVIQRGFIYSVLLTVIVGVYLAILFILHLIFEQTNLLSPVIGGLLTSILGIFTVPKIDKYLRRKTDPFFFKNHYDADEVLKDLSESLNHSIELSKIKYCIKTKLKATLKASAVRLETHPHTPKNKEDHELVKEVSDGGLEVELVSNDLSVGKLLIQKKLSGEPYTKGDKRLLETISHHLAIACERIDLYTKLQRYSNELEYKVKQRTTELEDLYRNQQAMISNIVHGIQTPLTIIRNEFEKLKTYPDTIHLSTLDHSLTSISTFLFDLLRLTQLESTSHKFDMRPLHLSELLTEIVTYTTIPITEKGIALEAIIEKDIWIQADGKRIEEMVLALISNAVKYIGSKPGKRILIELSNQDRQTFITIEDTGIGIPEQSLPRIFDRFYRAKDEHTENITGSGLGLSIASTIVKRHHGEILVTSTLGVGTEFTIKLPKIKTPEI